MPDRHQQRDCAAIAESENIGLIYVEIFEQRSRVICGLFEAERPVCNVRCVAVSLLLKRDHLPVAGKFRQHMAERGLYRVSAAMKQHKRRMRRAHGSMNLVINSEAVNRRVAFFNFHFVPSCSGLKLHQWQADQASLKNRIATRPAPAMILIRSTEYDQFSVRNGHYERPPKPVRRLSRRR